MPEFAFFLVGVAVGSALAFTFVYALWANHWRRQLDDARDQIDALNAALGAWIEKKAPRHD